MKEFAISGENQPSFRRQQIARAVFRGLITDWSEAMVLPKTLREELAASWPLALPAEVFESKNRLSTRALITLPDNQVIETVLMRHPDRNSVCVSSQVGCAMGCSFCATGKIGFKRNLTAWEIVNQVLFFARRLKKEKQHVNNVVFMGMGEPFLNYDNVLSAIRQLNDRSGFNLGARHMSVSTCGIVPGIRKFTKENLEVNLAISLHAPTDALRTKLMRINATYSIQSVLRAVNDYIHETRRRVMFEYILIEGVNDTKKCADRLSELMRQPLFFVNVIPYNPTGAYQPSRTSAVNRFIMLLRRNGVAATQRFSIGQDIMAACGQLAGNKQIIKK